MQSPEAVAAMLRLHGLGWGSRRIAAQLGCSRTTVKRYVAAAGWVPYRRAGRRRKLAGQAAWLQERLIRHRGNADVVRQNLERDLGITVTLRTLEREVAPLRQALAAQGAGDAAVRDTAGAAIADRLWRDASGAGRRADEAASVRCHAGLFAAAVRAIRSATSGNRPGSTAWRRHSAILAGCRANCWWTTRGRWWTTTTRPRAGCASTRGSPRSAGIGMSARVPRAVSGAYQRQGRARRRVCEAQRHRRARLPELGSAGGASRALDARGGRRSPAQPSIDPRQIRELAACRWVAHGEALLLLGPPRVGKTHLAIALGRAAIHEGYSVLFVTAPALESRNFRGESDQAAP